MASLQNGNKVSVLELLEQAAVLELLRLACKGLRAGGRGALRSHGLGQVDEQSQELLAVIHVLDPVEALLDLLPLAADAVRSGRGIRAEALVEQHAHTEGHLLGTRRHFRQLLHVMQFRGASVGDQRFKMPAKLVPRQEHLVESAFCCQLQEEQHGLRDGAILGQVGL